MQKFNKTYLFLIILVILFFSGFGYIFFKIQNLNEAISSISPKQALTNKNEENIAIPSLENNCSEDCKKEIEDRISQAISTVSATKTIIPTSTAVTKTETKIAYIPLSGPITSTSTGWVDAAGTDIYIDLVNDYGKNAKVSWEAFLKVAYGNGQVFARLYDATHGIGVDGSEISLVGTEVSTQVSSGNLNLWKGRNLYRVQIKSLNSFEVTFGSGRIKITY
ncbi:MAG: hypothetical protein ABIJ05_02010 [Patescibacteria group bacterium]